MPRQVWECACGDGALARMLVDAGYEVFASDLIDRGYGMGGVDFLTAPLRGDAIVTNPPFILADEFIRRANFMGVRYMALLLRAGFFNGPDRKKLWDEWPPARIHNLGWRPDLFGIGEPDERCKVTWFIWDRSHQEPFQQHFLHARPEKKTPAPIKSGFIGIDLAAPDSDRTEFIVINTRTRKIRPATDAEKQEFLLKSKGRVEAA